MSYEYNLRRLFQPPIDHLPVSEQLPYYRQRNLIHSHLYRFGKRVIPAGNSYVQQRVIDASLHSPRHGVGHRALLQRSLDGQPQKGSTDDASDNQDYICSESSVWNVGVKGSDLSESQYRKWMTDRRALRKSLGSVGANEEWLCSKERTPLENSLLMRMRNKSTELQLGKSTVALPKLFMESRSKSPLTIPPDPKKTLLKFKYQMIKEITLIESHLASHRQRFVSLLAVADRMHTSYIPVCDMLSIMNKIKTPLSQAATELLLQVLDIQGDSSMNYHQFLKNGGILKAVEEHFKRLEANLNADDKTHHSVENVSSDVSTIETAADLEKKYGAPSTLLGINGTYANDYKQEELKQFSLLINYCKENGIFLNWQVAKKALLLPPDKPQQDCLRELRQAGLALLSHDFCGTTEPVTEEHTEIIYKGFGKAYKEIHGQSKSVFMRLSTGGARIKTKSDCWLSFEEYMKLTEHIRSRPGFKYKDHGLPDNNAFWPGVLLDKLRLWLPSKSLMDNPYSLYNIFQPVTHPKVYNPYSPMVEQRTCWPENSNGYVQFGSQNRKQYQL